MFLHWRCRCNFVDNNSYMYNVFIFFTLSLKAFMVFSDCEARKQKTYSGFSLLNRANQACEKFLIVISTALSYMRSVDPKESTDTITLSHYLFFFSVILHAFTGLAKTACVYNDRKVLEEQGSTQVFYLLWDKIVKAVFARSYILVIHT